LGDKKIIPNFGGGNLFEDRGEYERVTLTEICCEGGRLIELTQDRVQWRGLVLAVLDLRVLQRVAEL
jgi:hypothetical protein